MAELRIEYDGRVPADQLKDSMDKATRRVRATMKALAQQAADEILTRGREDIQRAGRYGSDWTSGLHAKVEQFSADEVIVEVTHSKPYFNFLMTGGAIQGRPLLWIPTANVDEHIPASEYPGRLVRSTSKKGTPLLIDPNIESSSGTGWGHGEVMYTGFPSITMPQKFHTLDVIREAARNMKSKYKVTYSTSA